MAFTATTEARRHVEEIRRTKFSIGEVPNPLTEDPHQAVKNLSAERYAKDVHFLMELIQNAEDNEYPEGVDPSLEFVITSKDVTNTGAPATLLVFNNEKGFSRKNIESICSVGCSTKKGLRTHGYIGEKGIGFKSVFLITSEPYIFSNGYQIKFNEKPREQCNIGYIVPEWVDEDSTLSAIQSVYGLYTPLPTTTLVFPLNADKVKPVKDKLSSIHPEVLLFLSKIMRLSVREENDDPKHEVMTSISLFSERNFVTSKSTGAVSYTVHLTAGDGVDGECGYYMWKQRFPVKQENKVDARKEVDEWVITLAFPHGERLKRGSTFPGIYSLLPTETVTNFPFIIQADFLLASSREDILWDNIWNQGILDCVPDAFINAFTALVKSIENAPFSSRPNMFRFLPIKESSHPKLNHIRKAIKEKVMNENIIPCESYAGEKLFRKPIEVGRLKPAFWRILNKARSQGVTFSDIPHKVTYLLDSSFDYKEEYNVIMYYLEIKPVYGEWYARCIGSRNFVMRLSEDVYVELLVFVADWWSWFYSTNIKDTPLIKYVGLDGNFYLFKINEVSGTNKLLAANSKFRSWLINWSTELRCATGQFFLSKAIQEAILPCSKKPTVLARWLRDEVNIRFVSVFSYAELVSRSLNFNHKMAVTYAHFLYNSSKKNYLWTDDVQSLCSDMPIVNEYGDVTTTRNGVLLPGHGSRWAELIGSNPWRHHKYVELGEDYTRNATYFGEVTTGKEFFSFLKTYVKVYPSVEDCCELWKRWESSGRQITHDECCAFWEFVVQNWNARTEDTFCNNLLKLPVLDPSSNGVFLIDKREVFIGDDLFLTDLFQSCSSPIFVWFPQPNPKSDLTQTKLVDIYTKLGVRTLSESAQKHISDIDYAEFKAVNSKERIIKKGLLMLILGFLADPKLKIEPSKRHEAVSSVLAIETFETPEKLTVRYSLSLSNGDVVEVEPRRMIRWDKQQSKMFIQKIERSCSHKNVVEYAFHFAEEIAEGVLWENEELVPDLSELIRSGYLLEFEEEAVEFLMKMKNLQIYSEDREYLSSTFPSSKDNLQEIATPSPREKRRRGQTSITSSPSYELRSTKSQKRRIKVL